MVTTAVAAKRQSYLPHRTAAAMASSTKVGARLNTSTRTRKSTAADPRAMVRESAPVRLDWW
jgi:hypothetical protein